MSTRLALTAAALLLFTLTAPAADVPLSFADPERQARYAGLLEELRCLVCQNQSLADSHAELAQDLRNEVYRMIDAGHDSDAVIEFMVARYGNFVRYRPPFDATTLLLWATPGALAVLALIVIVTRSRQHLDPPRALSDDERATLAAVRRSHDAE